jgi:uncharacterized SAM-binding protein YcdF (DUF218 family)
LSKLTKILVALLLIALLWICVAPYLASRLIVEKKSARADAILVLAGSAAYIERTQKAAAIYREGKSKKILLSDDGERAGWSQAEQRNPPYVELAKRELVSQGVSEEAIEILPDEISSTYSEATALSRKMRDGNLHSVILVTSAYHTRRTLWTFEQALKDLNVEIGIEYAPIGQQTPPPFSWWLYPRGWNVVAGEYMKSLVYRTYYRD